MWNSSVIENIRRLRGSGDYQIDTRNSNRYRIVVNEENGHTSYCFSTPIYNSRNGKLVCSANVQDKFQFTAEGSDCYIKRNNNAFCLENKYGSFEITLPENIQINTGLTANGIFFKVAASSIKLTVKVNSVIRDTREDINCLSFMREKFVPFSVISPLFGVDRDGNLVPVLYENVKKGGNCYEVELYVEQRVEFLAFEINLYESKLFQDTTVQSAHPNRNNAYGTISFLGKTEAFGEQWLYARPDFSKLPELRTNKKIEHVKLHIPLFSGCGEQVDVFCPKYRFCSFGSTWNKKIPNDEKIKHAVCGNDYLTIDLTDWFANRSRNSLIYNEGMILKKHKSENNYIAISTADSYYAPQILEVYCK